MMRASIAALIACAFADAAHAQWIPGPSFPAPRTHVAALTQGTTIYALGGTPWLNGSDQDGSAHTLASGAGTWVAAAALDGMGPVLGQAAGIDALGRIVLFGGERTNGGGAGRTKVYSAVDGPSTTLALRPDTAPKRYFAWCSDAQGFLYSLGGGKGREAVPGEGNTNLCWRYVAASDTWQPIASMPQGVGDACAVYDGAGRVLVVGGVVADGGARTANVARYDIATDSWSDTAIPDLPAAVNGARAVVGSNGWIYVMGGEGGPLLEPTMLRTTWIYRPDLGAWQAGPELSTPRRYHGAVLGADDHVHVFGGENNAGGVATCERLFAPPCATITSHPQDTSVWSLQTANFQATVAGGSPLTFRWNWNGTPLADGPLPGGAWATGTTSTQLSIADATAAVAGAYTLTVSNACGASTSSAATLEILQPPSIRGAWIVRNLHPGWAETSSAADTWNGIQVGGGTQDVPPYNNLDQPTVWTGSAASSVLVNGPGSVGGALNAIQGGLKAGWWWWPYSCYVGGQWQTCYSRQASAIEADGTFRNLQVSGWEYSHAVATDGVQIVGTASTDDASGNVYSAAALWQRNSTGGFSYTLLSNPFGAAHSSASAVYDGRQYGSYWNAGVQFNGYHACMWSGSASTPVDMRPPGAAAASISGADLGQQCGTVDGHATLWSGAASSTTDIHPAGYLSSSLADVHLGAQVGSAVLGSATHAMIWAGDAMRYVDLHARLPANFTSSVANGVDVLPNGAIHVVGTGYNSTTSRNEALLWVMAPTTVRRAPGTHRPATPR
ncbi:MAG: hypothetical protein HY874_03075 [Chloroflexi bacterium]|nr:hypothetical protein [Chloroflexota bacterium]